MPPSAPTFGVSIPDNVGGTVLFGPLAFSTLNNLTTVTAGAYSLFYLDELNPAAAAVLGANVGVSDTLAAFVSAFANIVPANVLVDSEIVGLGPIGPAPNQVTVSRGLHGTVASSHLSGASVFTLGQQVFVVPFPKNFFGSPASGDWSHSVSFPNVRIVTAELVVTNSQGNSSPSTLDFTSLTDGGLRTLSGGQFSFQVGGFLAVQVGAAPDIIVDAPKVVRDVYAIVTQAPLGSPITLSILLNGNPYCSLTIADGATTVVAAIDGISLAPMHYQDRLSLNILGVGQVLPGSGLTVIIRV